MTDKIRKMIELARSHMEAGGTNAAGIYYRMVLNETNPPKSGVERVARGEACAWYARKAVAEDSLGTATDWYRRAVDADNRAVDYRLEFITKTLMPMNLLKMAKIEAERATKLEPDNIDTWKVLSGVEQALGNVKGAVYAAEKELSLAPNDPYARLDRCVIAMDMADYDTIEKMCEPVLKHKQLKGEAMHYLGMVAYRKGHHEKAIQLYDRAIEEGCGDPDLAMWNKSLPLQSIVRYAEGWAASEYRGKQKSDQAMRLIMNRFSVPMWKGERPTIDGKFNRLHLHQEMGFGDVIAMARYIPLLERMGFKITLEVNESLVSLFQRSFPQVNVIPKAIDYPGVMGLPAFDYHVPMLSLPAIFETSIDSVPWERPYLIPDYRLVTEYGERLKRSKRPYKIGLCWSSGIRHEGLWLAEYGKRKSMKYEDLEFMIVRKNRDASFVSLQVGDPDWDFNHPMQYLPEEPTWDDTAALIANLDLVVTVDTSVAHLAGAMGKPVLLMMHTEGSWHWMAPRPGASWNTSSPWYPSVKIFRQEHANEWGNVISKVGYEIQRIIESEKVCA